MPTSSAATAATPLPGRGGISPRAINETSSAAHRCPRCSAAFTPKRKDQHYCGRQCQKAATHNIARGPRHFENKERTARHYERAAWLSYDLNRMPRAKREGFLKGLLEAASGNNAPVRNILLDPKLLGAPRSSSVGKLYPDTQDPEGLNIAKMAHAYCMQTWGCSSRDAILDEGKPAGRSFTDETGQE